MTLSLPVTDYRQALPAADSAAAVMWPSVRAFYRWAKKNGVTPFRRGLFRRVDLADGLAREERIKAKRRGAK